MLLNSLLFIKNTWVYSDHMIPVHPLLGTCKLCDHQPLRRVLGQLEDLFVDLIVLFWDFFGRKLQFEFHLEVGMKTEVVAVVVVVVVVVEAAVVVVAVVVVVEAEQSVVDAVSEVVVEPVEQTVVYETGMLDCSTGLEEVV